MSPPPRRELAKGPALAYLVVAFALSCVANGPHAVGIAVWLAPLFWLGALHRLPVRLGALLGGLFYAAATVVAARGMLPLQGGFYVVAAAAIGFGALTPYLVHRVLAPYLPLPLGPLLLPIAASAMEFLGGLSQPFGSFGAVAYTQLGAPALLQIAAVAGLPGIALLVFLPAAVVHWALDHKPSSAQQRKGVFLVALLVAAAFGLGAARLRLAPRDTALVPIAIVSSPLHQRLSELLAPAYATGDPASVDWDAALAQGELVTADLLSRTQRAASAGARIVVWPETAAIVAADHEQQVIQRALLLTRSQGLYLAMALGVIRHRSRPWPASDGAIDNKVLLLGPSGQVVAEHRKAIAVPGPEAALLVPATAAVPIVATPYGRIALAICFDLDFPRLMRRAAGADLLLAPAEDWRGITPYHSDMARLRAIEGGYSIVRAGRYGRALMADAYGQVRAALDDSVIQGSPEGMLLAAVPVRGVPTIYARIGDAVGWLTTGCFFLLVLLALARWQSQRRDILLEQRKSRAGDHRDTPS